MRSRAILEKAERCQVGSVSQFNHVRHTGYTDTIKPSTQWAHALYEKQMILGRHTYLESERGPILMDIGHHQEVARYHVHMASAHPSCISALW